MRIILIAVLCLLPLTGGVRAQVATPAEPTLTLYRCSDARGHVSLQDAPCAKGLTQQVRTMARLRDPPPRPSPQAPAAKAQAPATPSPPMVYLAPPRPLYECTTPEGSRYASDDGRGNPRWVPQWTLGYAGLRPMPRPVPPLPAPPPVQPLAAAVSGSLSVTVGGHGHGGHGHGHGGAMGWPMPAGGRWIRDDCVMLPPAEACARLRDRRSAIRTRFFNAQEKERDALRLEERGLNARLDDDCGGR